MKQPRRKKDSTTPSEKKLSRKRLIITATDKGGVGKTHVLANLAQYIIDNNKSINLKAFDPDEANQSFMGYHKEITELLDPKEESSLDQIGYKLVFEHDLILVDALGSQQTQIFQEWIEDAEVLETLKDKDVDCTYLLVINNERENIAQSNDIMKRVGNSVDWLIVRNKIDKKYIKNPGLKLSNSNYWEGSETQKLANELGAIEVKFERINTAYANYLNQKFLTVKDAATSKNDSHDVFGGSRFRLIWKRMCAEIKKAEPIIFPTYE